MAQEIRGDLEVLRSLLALRSDTGILPITGTDTLDRHSASRVIATVAAAADLALPVSGLPVGWAVLVKNSGLSTANVALKAGSNVVGTVLPGRTMIVAAKVDAPAAAADWDVIEIPAFDANNQLTMGGKKIVNVADPTAAQDAATKNYVDTTREAAFAAKAGDGIVWDATNSEYDIDLATNSGLELVGGQLREVRDYAATFNATTDWGTAAGGYYTITKAAATHGQGTQCVMHLYRDVAGDFVSIMADLHKVAANGDVSFRVPATPDLRFAGKIIIQAIRS